ncbi:MAG TPA: ribonuclease HII [Candidatus Saccharibacteria bacterium]|nr:ribonuclease HII [Candidatus Saccharibacteria bacterium]HRK94492.1 ribonuclease HII [Candidatus Saccharibacteria bacterium]
MIVGIDEVGRGPWAGPLVVGAVVLGDVKIDGLTDSKMLSKKRREALATEIQSKAISYGLGWIEAAEIDELGLSKALEKATRLALEQITVPYSEIIIDGTVNFLKNTGKGPYVTTLKKADLLIASVSAASILAKVARDDYMSDQSELYPEYGFSGHVGYGTAAHKAALVAHGVTPLHRRSFAPIAALIGATEPNGAKPITTKLVGDGAEAVVANYLTENGYGVVERNWKTKFCEIDIVAQKSGTLYFVEVKHRKTANHGGGVAAITPRKLRQMRFAASLYLTRHIGMDARLAAATTIGESPQFEDFLFVD